ncbi:unnamed protein product [Mytilus edulis]|uniref:Novel STAND NTPase 3 domain-containing protein n=1 Tax=Mytilus edulis TaxID=6550 RepID=A0A8S3UMI3_MYTED|nr:unnamed protein product [Mytilus edulis]
MFDVCNNDDANINLDALDIEVEDDFELLLKDWQDNDRLFVDTKAAQNTANLLKTNNYVIVFGGLGVGKTAILRHIALKFLNVENYDIIPRVRTPVDIIKYLHPDRKQIFVVDDINNEPANSWSLQTNEILKRLKKQESSFKEILSKLKTLADETKRDSEDVVDDYEHLKWKAHAKKCNQPIIASKDIVKILLEHHANIEQCDIRGYTPLFAATINGTSQHGKVIKTLLDNNANISHCDNTGRTALLIACEKGFYKVVEILISQSEDIILKCDKEQKSPLFIACENGHANIVNMLVKKTKNAGIDQCDAKEDRLYSSLVL